MTRRPANIAARRVLPLLAAALAAPLAAQVPAFKEAGPLDSDTGYAMIEWTSSAPVSLQLRPEGDSAATRTIYSGGNSAYFISGLADGSYTLTLRDEAGATSAPLQLEVTHQSLSRALWLVALGALVFLMTVAAILRGER